MPSLTVRSPDGKEWDLPLAGPAIIGRRSNCDVPLADLKASRHHARIDREAGRWRVLDLDSRNGIRVNGEAAKERFLADGDVIEVGDHFLTFRLGNEPPPPDPGRLPAGFRLGAWTILEAAGSRPLGPAYVAKGPDGMPVRIQVLRLPEGEGAGWVERRLEEAMLAARVHHPSILPVLEARREGAIAYVASPGPPGRTLREQREQKGRLGAEQGLALAQSLGEALVLAHRCGLHHPYLSPDNVWLPDGGPVQMLDFGIRVPHAAADPRIAPFVAPEIRRAEPADPRSDLYALGALFAWAVQDGMLCFRDEPGERPGLEEELRRLGPTFAGLTKDAHAWVLKMVAEDSGARFQRAAEALLGPVEAEQTGAGMDSSLGLTRLLQKDLLGSLEKEFLEGAPSSSGSLPAVEPAAAPGRAAEAPGPPEPAGAQGSTPADPEPGDEPAGATSLPGATSGEIPPPSPVPWDRIVRGAVWAAGLVLALVVSLKVLEALRHPHTHAVDTGDAEAEERAFQDALMQEDAGRIEPAYNAYRQFLARYPVGLRAAEAERRARALLNRIQAERWEKQAREYFKVAAALKDKGPDVYPQVKKLLQEIIDKYGATRAAHDAREQLALLEEYEKGIAAQRQKEEAEKEVREAEDLLSGSKFEDARGRFEGLLKAHAAGDPWYARCQQGLQKALDAEEKLYQRLDDVVSGLLKVAPPRTLDLVQAKRALEAGIPLLQGKAWVGKAEARLAGLDGELASRHEKGRVEAVRLAKDLHYNDALERLKRLDQEFKSLANFGAATLDAKGRVQRAQALHLEVQGRFRKEGGRDTAVPVQGQGPGRVTGVDETGITLVVGTAPSSRISWRAMTPDELQAVYAAFVPREDPDWKDGYDAFRWIRAEAARTAPK